MELSIVIPQSPSDLFTRVSTYHSPCTPLKCSKTFSKAFPSAPKKEFKNKIFSWGEEYDIRDLYENLEETLITFENSFYKFNHNTRILIKSDLENNLKKLHLLVKDTKSWLRSTIFLDINDSEGEYYDYKYKNILNMFN